MGFCNTSGRKVVVTTSTRWGVSSCHSTLQQQKQTSNNQSCPNTLHVCSTYISLYLMYAVCLWVSSSVLVHDCRRSTSGHASKCSLTKFQRGHRGQVESLSNIKTTTKTKQRNETTTTRNECIQAMVGRIVCFRVVTVSE